MSVVLCVLCVLWVLWHLREPAGEDDALSGGVPAGEETGEDSTLLPALHDPFLRVPSRPRRVMRGLG